MVLAPGGGRGEGELDGNLAEQEAQGVGSDSEARRKKGGQHPESFAGVREDARL